MHEHGYPVRLVFAAATHRRLICTLDKRDKHTREGCDCLLLDYSYDRLSHNSPLGS